MKPSLSICPFDAILTRTFKVLTLTVHMAVDAALQSACSTFNFFFKFVSKNFRIVKYYAHIWNQCGKHQNVKQAYVWSSGSSDNL